jgi:hypothetical protein
MRANTGHGIFRTADGLQSVAWVGDRTYVRGDRFERPVAWDDDFNYGDTWQAVPEAFDFTTRVYVYDYTTPEGLPVFVEET